MGDFSARNWPVYFFPFILLLVFSLPFFNQKTKNKTEGKKSRGIDKKKPKRLKEEEII